MSSLVKNNSESSEGWKIIPFLKAAIVVSDEGKRVKQRDYLLEGKIPVIDQGHDFIGGYIDDENMAFKGDLPVIIFGDHTRNIKYVNRRFAVGAEGVKILKPESCYEPKFFYYMLHSLEIPSRGYSRHFQFLKKFDFPLPHLDQQKLIVSEIEKQFSRLDEAVATLKRVRASLKRYKASVLKAAVEGKLATSEQKKWKATTVGEVSEIVTKGSSPNWQGFEYSSEGVVFVRSQNVSWGHLNLSEVAHLPLAFNKKEKKSVLRTGDVLLNIVGASIGRAAVATKSIEGGNINQAVAVIRPLRDRLLPQFLMCYFLSEKVQKLIHAQKVDVARANYSLDQIRKMPLHLPPLDDQHRIVEEIESRLSVAEEIGVTININLKRSERLRQAILKKAFAGKLI